MNDPQARPTLLITVTVEDDGSYSFVAAWLCPPEGESKLVAHEGPFDETNLELANELENVDITFEYSCRDDQADQAEMHAEDTRAWLVDRGASSVRVRRILREAALLRATGG